MAVEHLTLPRGRSFLDAGIPHPESRNRDGLSSKELGGDEVASCRPSAPEAAASSQRCILRLIQVNSLLAIGV